MTEQNELSQKQKHHLRGLGHSIKPVVQLGNSGLTDAVLCQIEEAIDHHELIKVRVLAADREEKQQFIDRIIEHTAAHLIQKVGHMILIYRKHPEKPKIELPKG